ncbi:MAG TPA: D-alanine--D-alanine ligase [Alphaproteobacteria bacterium]|nr:D-alanine--D-alanine ligase [Alphaproteobacteria bacterium]HNS44126.1 D-alanine--D-alanine ligase [Alphaproteobacteria bacterium]
MAKSVALLVGGWSAERDVSLEKGKAVEAALIEAGYDVRTIDVRKNLPALIEALTPRPDAIFNNLHGRGGEDGIIQGVLEMIGVPYTHSGVLASAIGMNKAMSRAIVASVGVPIAKGGVFSVKDIVAGKALPRPFVVKPVQEGSSVGVKIVREMDNSPPIDMSDWAFGDMALVEQYIPGKELTVAVLDGKAQAVTEIISHTGFFDYEAKYKDVRTETVCPAKIPQDVYNKALEYAEAVYKVCGCQGLARCDFRFDDTKGVNGLCFLEINTQPGCTPQSIGPSQVITNGLSFSGLCAHLVETAKCLDPVPAEPASLTDAQDKKRA